MSKSTILDYLYSNIIKFLNLPVTTMNLYILIIDTSKNFDARLFNIHKPKKFWK